MSAQQSVGLITLCLTAFQRQPFTAAISSSSMGFCHLAEEIKQFAHTGRVTSPCLTAFERHTSTWRSSYSSGRLTTQGFLMPQSAGPSAEGFSTKWTSPHLQRCQRG